MLSWLYRASLRLDETHTRNRPGSSGRSAGIGVGPWTALLMGAPPFICSAGPGGVSACPAVHALPMFAPLICALFGAAAAAFTAIGSVGLRHSISI